MRSERLHPSAFVVEALSGLRETLFPAVIAFVVSGRGLSSAAAIGLIAVAASAVLGYVRWSRTRYWVEDDALHFRSGVLSPDQKTVPLARIAAVDEVQGPVQRAFGVVALHVQTAGGGGTAEVVLTAVERDRAAALRRALGRLTTAPEEAADLPQWRLSTPALLVAAVTGPQIGVVLPLVAGIAGVLPQTLGDQDTERVLARAPELAGGWPALAAIVVVAIVALSLIGAVVAFGGFVVAREPRRLRLRRGLVQRRAATVGIERVHALRIVEGPLRRPLGLCAVRLEVAGYAKEASAAQTLIPLCRRSEVAAVLARLVPELPAPAGAPERPPRRAGRRYVIGPALGGAVTGLVAAVAASAAGAPAGVWAAVAIGVLAGAVVGVARLRAAGWWVEHPVAVPASADPAAGRRPDVVAIRRHGVLARATTVAAATRLQHADLRRSLLQRRARLGTVGFAVASGHRTAIAHLEAAVADALFASLRPRPRAAGASGRAAGAGSVGWAPPVAPMLPPSPLGADGAGPGVERPVG